MALTDAPRHVSARSLDDLLCLAGSAVGSLAATWLLYTQVLPTVGRLGFVLVWLLTFLVLYAATTAFANPRPIVVERVAATALHAAAAALLLVLASAIFYVFHRGWHALPHKNFYLKDTSSVGPTDPLTKGGIGQAILGSAIELGIASAVALPLGITTAVFMSEVGGRAARVVRTVVEAMTALPSIVAGLFVYVVLVVHLGAGKTGFAGSMAILVMMLPIVARASDVALRVVPGGLREASLALGAPQWRTVLQVVLPTARSGLATALILAVARSVGETSPVLLTSGASPYWNADPLHDNMNSLPLFIFDQVRVSTFPAAITRGYGAASVLLLLVLTLFVLTRLLARQRRRPGPIVRLLSRRAHSRRTP